MELKSLADEQYREYEYGAPPHRVVYHINDPVSLAVGATTHRVVDKDGVVHCLPAPGHLGCALRWKPRDAAKPVQF
jgi:hypothetical protein